MTRPDDENSGQPPGPVQRFGPYGVALSLGVVGGVIASYITLPLPWMLGPMIVCLIASIAGLPIKGPVKIRPLMICVIGVMLGSGFTPEMANRIGDWLFSMGMLFAYCVVIGAVVYPYFRRVAGYDPVTAYFSAMPGGLNEMMIVGGEYGGDERRIVLTHASRVLLAVLLIPIWFRIVEGLDMGDRSQLGPSLANSQARDLIILTLCGVAGYLLGRVLRLPARNLLGPMLVSAVVHLMGWTEMPPPNEIVNLAQLFIGTVIGCRFAGLDAISILRILWIGLGATVLMIGITVIFATIMGMMTDLEPLMVVLAFAPGGLAEMALVALAMRADVAYVATHHVVRLAFVVLLAPFAFKFLNPERKRERKLR